MKVRFLEARPVSEVTVKFLAWMLAELAQEGKRALFLIWDNACWHASKKVREWLKEHNRQAQREGGVRVLRCQLPSQSPWLNPIEAHWRHGKRAICEPAGELSQEMIEQRICAYFNAERLPQLANNVP